MADDLDALARRLDRIEQLLRRPPTSPPAAGPEVRSARSIVGRLDDVWVAVTEGNERLGTALNGLASEGRAAAPSAGGAERPEAEAVHLRLNRIEEALAGLAARMEEAPGVAAGRSTAPGAAFTQLADEVRALASRVDELVRLVDGDGDEVRRRRFRK